MLFNSYEFIFAFLPITIVVFFVLGSRGLQRTALLWLVLMSLLFYSWWNPAYLPLICLSTVANYLLGWCLALPRLSLMARKLCLIAGIVSNLLLLGYYKYAMFAATNLNAWLGLDFPEIEVTLPLAISFFTFQQLGYLIDTYRRRERPKFVDYCLFVTFFPQLIAGPIVQHTDLIPQLKKPEIFKPRTRNLEVGLTIFFLGLFKKLIIADEIAKFANVAFNQAALGGTLGIVDSWLAAIAYTLQIYFDFSGYSDMAIGLGAIFGIRFPVNFNSPYRATSIIDFWRRWHITLSVFLRDYLYIPLGGSRRGKFRRYLNLLATMVLGGLWHGAGWTFVAWGMLHGVSLAVNHAWREHRGSVPAEDATSPWRRGTCWGMTFLVVVIGWVVFRADDLPSAGRMLSSMAGMPTSFGAVVASEGDTLAKRMAAANLATITPGPTRPMRQLEIAGILGAVLCLACWAPNIPSLMSREGEVVSNLIAKDLPACPPALFWRPSRSWALGMAALTVYCILCLNRGSEFLYFRF